MEPDELEARLRELHAEKEENLKIRERVRLKLTEARRRSAYMRRYADPLQYTDWEREVWERGRRDQQLQHDIGAVNKELRHVRRRGFAECFVDAARARLPPEVFRALSDEAGARQSVWTGEQAVLADTERFWRELRTAEQKGHDRPVNLDAVRVLSR